MTIFDLLFLALALSTVLTLLAAAYRALRRDGARALRILRRLAISAVVYVAIVAISSIFVPRKVLGMGEPDCFDDWCIAVESSMHTPGHTPAEVSYQLALRVSSRARRVSQHEYGVVVYLTDAGGKRYDPVPIPSDVPISVLVGPGESVPATRTYQVPVGAKGLGAVIGHEGGGFPIGWFIIGYETWFRKPAIVPLP